MWTGKILDSSLHRKCVMSGGLWAAFVFGHLCSASAGVGCCGLNPDTRSRPGLFSLRAYRGGSRKQKAAKKCFDRKWEWTSNGLMWRNSRGTCVSGWDAEGMGRGYKFWAAAQWHSERPHTPRVDRANPLICPATNRVHLWLNSVEIK